jgi:hypothetical protein
MTDRTPTDSMRPLPRTQTTSEHCLSCGTRIDESLLRIGSLRCQRCSDLELPLDARLLELRAAEHRNGADDPPGPSAA